MSSHQLDIQIVAVMVAASCSIPGVFLVLRKMSMMADAISHSILLGIIIAFFLVQDISSPFLVMGAAASGVLAVSLIETVNRSRLVRKDASMGIVFPFLFSVAVILISMYARNVHIDVHSVLLGEIAFAPFNRVAVAGVDFGPKSAWVMGFILVVNLVFLSLFYKELKISTFDRSFASSVGFRPGLMHYLLMTVVSITCVGAFDAVGSILVVALIVIPPCCAYLLTDSLSEMILLSAVFGVLAAVSGFWAATLLDVNIAGSMAVMCGVLFIAVFLFSPRRGLLGMMRERRKQKTDFAESLFLVSLYNQERGQALSDHSRGQGIFDSADSVRRVARTLKGRGDVAMSGDRFSLTDKGREKAKLAVAGK